MTTPRDPYDRDPYERDPAERDPYERDPYRRSGHGAEESATWGRAPAGGWGAAAGADRYDAGYDEPDTGYDEAAWDAPARGVEPRYGRSDHEPGERHGRSGRRAAGYTPSWAPGPPTAGRRAVQARRRALVVVLGLVAVLVLAVLVLGFVTPGWFVTRVFDATAVQTGVAKILADDYATDGVADVRCPERVQVVPGATFTCTATIDGDAVTIPVRVTDAKGGYVVGRPT